MPLFRRLGTLIAIAGIALSPGSESSAQTKLELKFQEGETVSQEMLESVRVDVIPPGEKKIFTTVIDQRWFLESTTTKLLEGNAAEVRQKFTRISLSIQLPPPVSKLLTVDTSKPIASEEKVEQEMRYGIAKVIGLGWIMTQEPNGSVRNVALTDELADVLVENPQAGPLKDTFSDAGLRKLTEQSSVTFPDRPIRKGDTWEQVLTRSFPEGKLSIKRTCTSMGAVENGLEKIVFKTETTYQPNQDAKKKLTLSDNSGEGELLVDPATGRTVRSKMTQVLVFKEGPEDRQGTQRLKIVSTLLPADASQPKE